MENIEKPKAKQAKKKEAQRWPYIKRRPYPSGLVSWIVDARTKSGGERKTFVTLAEAETYADGWGQLRVIPTDAICELCLVFA